MKLNLIYALWIEAQAAPAEVLNRVLDIIDYAGLRDFEYDVHVKDRVACLLADGTTIAVKPIFALDNPIRNAGAEFNIKTNCRIALTGGEDEQLLLQRLILLVNEWLPTLESDAYIESRFDDLLLKRDGRYFIPAGVWDDAYLAQLEINYDIVGSL